MLQGGCDSMEVLAHVETSTCGRGLHVCYCLHTQARTCVQVQAAKKDIHPKIYDEAKVRKLSRGQTCCDTCAWTATTLYTGDLQW